MPLSIVNMSRLLHRRAWVMLVGRSVLLAITAQVCVSVY